MKTKQWTIIAWIAGIALAIVILFAGFKYGIPFVESQSKYAEDLPTIEVLQQKNDSLTITCDSLRGVITQIENAGALQNALINDASKRNQKLQEKYNKLADIFSRIPESELDAFIKQFNQ